MPLYTSVGGVIKDIGPLIVTKSDTTKLINDLDTSVNGVLKPIVEDSELKNIDYVEGRIGGDCRYQTFDRSTGTSVFGDSTPSITLSDYSDKAIWVYNTNQISNLVYSGYYVQLSWKYYVHYKNGLVAHIESLKNSATITISGTYRTRYGGSAVASSNRNWTFWINTFESDDQHSLTQASHTLNVTGNSYSLKERTANFLEERSWDMCISPRQYGWDYVEIAITDLILTINGTKYSVIFNTDYMIK